MTPALFVNFLLMAPGALGSQAGAAVQSPPRAQWARSLPWLQSGWSVSLLSQGGLDCQDPSLSQLRELLTGRTPFWANHCCCSRCAAGDVGRRAPGWVSLSRRAFVRHPAVTSPPHGCLAVSPVPVEFWISGAFPRVCVHMALPYVGGHQQVPGQALTRCPVLSWRLGHTATPWQATLLLTCPPGLGLEVTSGTASDPRLPAVQVLSEGSPLPSPLRSPPAVRPQEAAEEVTAAPGRPAREAGLGWCPRVHQHQQWQLHPPGRVHAGRQGPTGLRVPAEAGIQGGRRRGSEACFSAGAAPQARGWRGPLWGRVLQASSLGVAVSQEVSLTVFPRLVQDESGWPAAGSIGPLGLVGEAGWPHWGGGSPEAREADPHGAGRAGPRRL